MRVFCFDFFILVASDFRINNGSTDQKCDFYVVFVQYVTFGVSTICQGRSIRVGELGSPISAPNCMDI
jgi:hypothetical protein